MLFFFNDTATTEIYTLSLHDALPILQVDAGQRAEHQQGRHLAHAGADAPVDEALPGERRQAHPERAVPDPARSEEHTSELQSRQYLVCRLLLEKKKKHRDNASRKHRE